MSKKRHHYVPKFYLRNFSSDSIRRKLTHVYVIGRSKAFRDVSLEAQCYRWKFYGDTDVLEDILAQFETSVAPIIRGVIEASALPPLDSEMCGTLRDFVALQMLRTTSEIDRLTLGHEKMMALVGKKIPTEYINIDPESLTKQSVLIALDSWPTVSKHLKDLGIHLIRNTSSHDFITSDSPVIKYNQYCEGLQGAGTDGAMSAGLLVFVPISPRHLIMCYDKQVYKVGNKRSTCTETANLRDIQQMNLLQSIHAEKIILFANWASLEEVHTSLTRAVRFRRLERVRVVEAVADDDKNRSLLHLHNHNFDISLNLSFMSIRRDANKIPKFKRAMLCRDTNPEGAWTNAQRRMRNPGSTLTRYVVKKPDPNADT
jgi:Protein of unknown function (DUF4238)